MTQRVITVPMVNQGNNDILPFTLMAESGYVANSSALSFTIEMASSKYLEYQAIIDRNNSSVLSNVNSQSTYVPQSEEARYTHQSSFQADIIGKDVGGIKEIRTHVEPYGYEFEEISDNDTVFVIPKFTWENAWTQLVTTTTTTPLSNNSMWIGTSSNQLSHVQYTNTESSVVSTDDLGSPVQKIMFGTGNDSMYVSTPNYHYQFRT